MAFQPIYGYSGDHPVLDFAGTTPVCMEPWAKTAGSPVSVIDLGNVTTSTAINEFTVTSLGSGGVYANCVIYYLYAGSATQTVTYTYGGTYNANIGASVQFYIGTQNVDSAAGGMIQFFPSGFASGSQANYTVPYYRYRISIVISGYAEQAGDWAKLTIS